MTMMLEAAAMDSMHSHVIKKRVMGGRGRRATGQIDRQPDDGSQSPAPTLALAPPATKFGCQDVH
jgi:hypothetical protein